MQFQLLLAQTKGNQERRQPYKERPTVAHGNPVAFLRRLGFVRVLHWHLRWQRTTLRYGRGAPGRLRDAEGERSPHGGSPLRQDEVHHWVGVRAHLRDLLHLCEVWEAVGDLPRKWRGSKHVKQANPAKTWF